MQSSLNTRSSSSGVEPIRTVTLGPLQVEIANRWHRRRRSPATLQRCSVHDVWAPYDTDIDAAGTSCAARTRCANCRAWPTPLTPAATGAGHPSPRRPGRDATPGHRGCRRRADQLDPEGAGRTSPALPQRGPDRPHRNRRPQRQSDEEAQRARPAPAPPPRRIPAIHYRLANPARQQRIRTRHPHDQTQAEGLRMPSHIHRPQNSSAPSEATYHRRQSMDASASKPWSCWPGKALGTRSHLTSYRYSSLSILSGHSVPALSSSPAWTRSNGPQPPGGQATASRSSPACPSTRRLRCCSNWSR